MSHVCFLRLGRCEAALNERLRRAGSIQENGSAIRVNVVLTNDARPGSKQSRHGQNLQAILHKPT